MLKLNIMEYMFIFVKQSQLPVILMNFGIEYIIS